MNSRPTNRGGLLLLALIGCGLLIASLVAVEAQEESQLFPETGKRVSGRFLDYWKANGGLARQGLPLSDRLQEKSDLDGKVYTLQYFERAVFEHHPENRPPHDILLSQLGRFRFRDKYANAPPHEDNTPRPGSVAFPETGKRLSGRFLDYWRQNGELAQFGYPISGELLEVSPLDGNTYLMQYFERAVFEHHPRNAAPNDVLLSHLGRLRYEAVISSGSAGATPTPRPPRPRFGIVGQGGLGEQLNPRLLRAEYEAGVRVRFVQLGWDVLQPGGPASWDTGIANAFQQRIDAFVASGSDVQLVLDLGIQYSPGWVNSIDPLVDQYGNVYQAGFPNGGVNVYWSPTVRRHVAAYIQRAFTSLNFHGHLWAVRVGPYRGELLYPERSSSEQSDSFWAFDPQAQAQSPVGNWKPGDPSENGEARKFYLWYVDNLVGTFNFFLTEIRRYYPGYVAPVTPGAGIHSALADRLIDRRLSDPTVSTYGTGNYWERIFSLLPRGDQNVINWCSSMGDGSGNDSSPNWWEWSSARIQAYLAHTNGRPIYGENSAPNPYDTSSEVDPRTTMQWIFAAMRDYNYLGLIWLDPSHMTDPRFPTLSQYQALIDAYR